MARTVNPTIAFNESVRLLNNDAITNTNIDAVVEVRLNNASGTLVPFDATFASNTITIVPTTVLKIIISQAEWEAFNSRGTTLIVY